MKETVQLAIKKLSILENRIDSLVQLNRLEEALVRCKKLFHLSSSFAVILFLHESESLFCEQLANAVSDSICDFLASDLGSSDENVPVIHLRLKKQKTDHDVSASDISLS